MSVIRLNHSPGDKLFTVNVFGPNLRDQSKGDFVVHSVYCRDCRKLRNEECSTVETPDRKSIVEFIFPQDCFGYEDWQIPRQDFHFCPCVDALPERAEIQSKE